MAKVTSSNDTKVVAELDAIDASWLDELSAIRAEQQRLDGYRRKAEPLKPGVTESVWRKVIDEYDGRSRQLVERAAPLLGRGHDAVQKIEALAARVDAVRAAALLDKDEWEFRHAVGEVDDAALRAGLKVPQDLIARCDADLAAIERQGVRFSGVIGADARPPAPAPAPLPPTPAPPPIQLPSPPLPQAEPPAPAPVETPAAKPAGIDPSDANSTVPLSEAGRRAAVAGVPPRPVSAPSSPEKPVPSEAGTFVLPPAAVLVTIGDQKRTEHVLSAMTQIGRADDSRIQLALSGVSRRHAMITAAAEGFILRDLSSQSGTFVNGERIRERALVDGDCIVIGDSQIVFRTPWPEDFS